MPNCIKCRAELPKDALFCHLCGKKQTVTQRKRTKRPNGFGSVYKEGGTWVAEVTRCYAPSATGKIRRKRVRKRGFNSEKEAMEYLAVLKAEKERTTHVTFAKLYDLWLPTHRAGRSTMNCYKAAYKYFAEIQHLYMDEITIDDLQECVDECPKGKSTRGNMKTLCGLLYDYAIPRHLATLNLKDYIVVTGEAAVHRVGFTTDQLEQIHRAIGRVQYADYIYALCYLGYRPSEFVTLTVEDYHPEGHYFVAGSKTAAGIDRIVTVSPKIQPLIDRFIAGRTSGPILHTGDGKPISYTKWREDCFYPALDKIGIDNPVQADGRHRYAPHCCRHTFATMLKRVDGADKDKLELIGHSDTRMLRHYQDVALEDLRRLTDAI